MPPLTRNLLTAWVALWACLATSQAARADAGLHSYALVIGSNRGGEGQGELSYAQQDAERVAALLGELGRTPRDHIALLHEPRAREVEQALAALRDKLTAHAARGERAQLLFYYSGHARARALSLGSEELSLSDLRASLLALPSTLTVVVLDACQSGAFSGVKGAAPSADFSISSVRDLNSTGIAVMASSTGTELSQESSELGSSYFTHHLLVSLRGAGDLDRNGRVSLDEAYGYAYQHTLSDTARTQVGSQHATLETELTGRGDVPLSYPVDADAQLALPGDVEGRVLVQRAQQGPVMAELVKARGGTLLLALASGSYDVLVRGERDAKSCAVMLQKGVVHTLALHTCRTVALPTAASKNSEPASRERREARESWFAEFGYYAGVGHRDDAYLRTLQTFGYDSTAGGKFGPGAAVGYQLRENLALLARYDLVERNATERGNAEDSINFAKLRWTTHTALLGARLRLPLAGHWVVAFAELDAGLALASVELSSKVSTDVGSSSLDHSERQLSFALRGLAGFTFGLTKYFGLYLAGGYTHAPALQNELGQRHQSGGITIVNGLRLNGVKGWW